VLREAIVAATRSGDRTTAVTAHRELGFIDVQAGRRATADEWLGRAEGLAENDRELAAIQGVRGMNASDMGDYPAAFVHFGESVERAARSGDDRQRAWSLSLLGRAHLLRGERSQALAALGESLDVVHQQRWLAFQPWPQALLADVSLADGDRDRASEILEQAWTLACQVGDPCWESVCARGLGLVYAGRGEHREADQWLREATQRANRTPDRYLWVLGHALDAAIGQAIERREHERAASLAADLTWVAARTQMRELTVRAHLHRYRLGDASALAGARLLAADIDNPALAELLR
jgi:tetratricopeptide (TPR) repeat protein